MYIFQLIFLHFATKSCKKSEKSCKNVWKNTEKGDFDPCLECAAPKSTWKHTTQDLVSPPNNRVTSSIVQVTEKETVLCV